MRRRRLFSPALLLLLGGGAVLGAGALAVRERPRIEAAIVARIEREGRRQGVVARADRARLGPWPPLRIDGLRIEKPGAWSVSADVLEVRPRLFGSGLVGRARILVRHLVASGPGGLSLESERTEWDVVRGPGRRLGAKLYGPSQGLVLAWDPSEASELFLADAHGFAAGDILSLRRDGLPVLDAGTLSGSCRLVRSGGRTGVEVDMRGTGVRLASLQAETSLFDPPTMGQPTDIALELSGSWRKDEGALEVPHWRARVDGAALSGSLTLSGVGTDPRLEVALDVERVEFARLLRTSGLESGGGGAKNGVAPDADLGAASLSARVTGRLQDPASFVVSQKLDFTPPRQLPEALLRLRSDFVHQVVLPGEGRRDISVSQDSPDFIAIKDVPPLFLRTLLIAEDADFYGHRGIDLSELPSAILTNWKDGGFGRGASTITQQLAKNLFLSRDKNLGRKLKELSLALLLESTLTKQRILEIYLNVIEWGPSLYGLRPASRHYFHKEPGELSPTQMAFLVAIIPGPIKYQRSISQGAPSPFLRDLVDRLLVKLRSLDALSEEEYEAARAEPIAVDVPGAAGAASDTTADPLSP